MMIHVSDAVKLFIDIYMDSVFLLLNIWKIYRKYVLAEWERSVGWEQLILITGELKSVS